MTDTIETRVARGAALLDEKLPGRADRIDLDILELSNGCNCILGQEFDDDNAKVERIGYDVGLAELFGGDEDAAAQHGFTMGREADETEWDRLEDEWKRVILARREEASC